MPILFCSLDLYLPYCHSLKEKRKVVKSTGDKLRNKFKCSVSELEHQELWQRSRLGIAAIASDRQILDQMSEKIRRESEMLLGGDLLGFSDQIIELD
ncbi:MAG: DUF503 domain-containing protein [Acidobacteriota bacterium]|nr:MAG: DUF503 domain-containing protein [Acidobacteriota bacterium]